MSNKLLGLIRALGRDEAGNALLVGVAALPVVIGAAGFAVDTAQILVATRSIQRTADSAAIAGAYAVLNTFPASEGVDRDLEINNRTPLSSAPVIENAPTTGPGAGNSRAVRVVLRTTRTLTFMSMFNIASKDIRVEATAAAIRRGEFCMLALDDGTSAGVTMGGNTTVDVGCGISSNSRASAAITVDGSASVRATPIMAVGGVPQSRGYAQGTELIPYTAPQQDPFSSLPLPQPSNCTPSQVVNSGQTRHFQPGGDGTACMSGLDIRGTATFAPGTYYINGNSLQFGAQAQVSGTGVTFILTSTNAVSNPSSIATMSVNGGAVMNLTSPTSGAFKGILFYEDPRALVGRSIRYNGNSGSSLEGAFYFPRAYFEFSGTTGMRTQCMQLVARRLHFTGNSRIENTCPETGGGRAFNGTYIRLIG